MTAHKLRKAWYVFICELDDLPGDNTHWDNGKPKAFNSWRGGIDRAIAYPSRKAALKSIEELSERYKDIPNRRAYGIYEGTAFIVDGELVEPKEKLLKELDLHNLPRNNLAPEPEAERYMTDEDDLFDPSLSDD